RAGRRLWLWPVWNRRLWIGRPWRLVGLLAMDGLSAVELLVWQYGGEQSGRLLRLEHTVLLRLLPRRQRRLPGALGYCEQSAGGNTGRLCSVGRFAGDRDRGRDERSARLDAAWYVQRGDEPE